MSTTEKLRECMNNRRAIGAKEGDVCCLTAMLRSGSDHCAVTGMKVQQHGGELEYSVRRSAVQVVSGKWGRCL
jgi:hypothetical protein